MDIEALRNKNYGNYISLSSMIEGLRNKMTVYTYDMNPLNRIPLLNKFIFGCALLEDGVAVLLVKDIISYPSYLKVFCHPLFDFTDRFKMAASCGELKLYDDESMEDSIRKWNQEYENKDQKMILICQTDGSHELIIKG